MKIPNSPYNLRETLGYFKRNFFGPVSRNRFLTNYAPAQFELNPGVSRKLRIGFIGDIMDMAGRNLRVGKQLTDFLRDCDVLVGNFEATITAAKGPIMAQRHKTQILDALSELFDPARTFLGLANNHSGDFGYETWSESLRQIAERGFRVFGTAAAPFVDIDQQVRITACTWWSNQPVDYIVFENRAVEYVRPAGFNILYPHWGYEMELFPRSSTIAAGREWLKHFDAIIGHHSHTPQPIASLPDGSRPGRSRLVAYGLGDFCIWEKLQHYLFGQVLKVEIGSTAEGELDIGQVRWRFTTCRRVSEQLWETELTDHFPYLEAG